MNVLPLVLALIGCAAPEEPADTGDGAVRTDAGLYDLVLTPDPDPPVAGDAALDIAIAVVATGAALEGAAVTVEPWMTDMGHGTPEPPVVEETGGGAYRATWTYSMPGTWDVTVGVDGEAGVDSATVVYDVG